MARRDDEFTAWALEAIPSLRRRGFLLAGERAGAEDLVQETLTRLYVHWNRVDLDANPLGYAHSTLYHVFVSGRRRRSATEVPVGDVLHGERVDDRDGRRDLHRTELRLDLVQALDSLSAKERCVVVARYLDDLSVADVATLMRRPEGWVRTTAHRALRRLRDSPALLSELTA